MLNMIRLLGAVGTNGGCGGGLSRSGSGRLAELTVLTALVAIDGRFNLSKMRFCRLPQIYTWAVESASQWS
jgi:hypothetical protein